MNCAQKNENTMKPAQASGSPDRRKRSRLLDAEVGQSIRAYRKSAKMTLQDMADRLGIAYQQVQKYETGVNRIGAGRLMEIAEILDIPVASFFNHPAGGSEAVGDISSDGDAAVQGRQLLVWFLRISDPQKRRAVLSYVKALTETD